MNNRVIAIAGVSGSGKTTLAQSLVERAHRHWGFAPTVMAQDGYYRDFSHLPIAERETINFDHPESFDIDGLIEHLSQLRDNKAVRLRGYDYVSHRPVALARDSYPTPVILVEGILVMHWPELRELTDYGVYLDVPVDVCAQRRLDRDIRERGRSEVSVRCQFREHVLPMYHQYVHPQKRLADRVLHGAEGIDALWESLERELCKA